MFTVLFGYFNLNHTYFWYRFECWWHWNKSSKWKAYLACLYMTFKRDCREMFVSLLHLCVCRDLLHIVSLLTIYVVGRNVVAYFHAHIWRVQDQYWQTSPNESVLHFEVVFVVCWHQIGNLVQVVYIKVSLILIKLHNFFVKKAYIEDVETNLPIAKHTLRAFTWHVQKIVDKSLVWCFIYVVVLICWIWGHF